MSPKGDYNNLNVWIPSQLKRTGLTVEKLANRAGISRTNVYRWMYDTDRPKESAMISVCRVLSEGMSERKKVSLLEEGMAQYTPKKMGRPAGSGGGPREVRVSVRKKAK